MKLRKLMRMSNATTAPASKLVPPSSAASVHSVSRRPRNRTSTTSATAPNAAAVVGSASRSSVSRMFAETTKPPATAAGGETVCATSSTARGGADRDRPVPGRRVQALQHEQRPPEAPVLLAQPAREQHGQLRRRDRSFARGAEQLVERGAIIVRQRGLHARASAAARSRASSARLSAVSGGTEIVGRDQPRADRRQRDLLHGAGERGADHALPARASRS